MTNRYETVFILTPVLSAEQVKETVVKFKKSLKSAGAKLMHEEDWGLKKLAYPIQKKKSGFYHLLEYKVAGEEISAFELEFRRDDSVMRYLSVRLDKHAAAWAKIRTERVKSTKK